MAAWTEDGVFMARPDEEGAVTQVGDSEMGSGTWSRPPSTT